MELHDTIYIRLKASVAVRERQVIQIKFIVCQKYTNVGLKVTINISLYKK